MRSYHFVAEVTFKNNFRPYSNYGRDSVTFNKKGISSSLFPLAAGGLISLSSFHDSKKDYTLTIHTVHFVSALLSKLRREDILVFQSRVFIKISFQKNINVNRQPELHVKIYIFSFNSEAVLAMG